MAKMQCLPLYSMLMALDNPIVDYMSLDIEGAEEAVLKTIPWDKVDIKVISLEIITAKLDDNAEGEHHNPYPTIFNLLTSHDYTLVRADWHTPDRKSIEAYFVKNDVAKTIDKKYWKPLEDE